MDKKFFHKYYIRFQISAMEYMENCLAPNLSQTGAEAD